MQEPNATRRGGLRSPAGGRPRRPPTLAAAVRESFPLERLIEMAERLATSQSEDTRRWALQWLAERGHGKVADKHEISAAAQDPDALTDEQLEQLTDSQLDELERADEQHALAVRQILALPAVTSG